MRRCTNVEKNVFVFAFLRVFKKTEDAWRNELDRTVFKFLRSNGVGYANNASDPRLTIEFLNSELVFPPTEVVGRAIFVAVRKRNLVTVLDKRIATRNGEFLKRAVYRESLPRHGVLEFALGQNELLEPVNGDTVHGRAIKLLIPRACKNRSPKLVGSRRRDYGQCHIRSTFGPLRIARTAKRTFVNCKPLILQSLIARFDSRWQRYATRHVRIVPYVSNYVNRLSSEFDQCSH